MFMLILKYALKERLLLRPTRYFQKADPELLLESGVRRILLLLLSCIASPFNWKAWTPVESKDGIAAVIGVCARALTAVDARIAPKARVCVSRETKGRKVIDLFL